MNLFNNSEILPQGYNTQVIRKDRNTNGGGVLIAAKDQIQLNELKSDAECEIKWAELQTTKGNVIWVRQRNGGYAVSPILDLSSHGTCKVCCIDL